MARDQVVYRVRNVLERVRNADQVGAMLVGAMSRSDFRVFLVVDDGQIDRARNVVLGVLALTAGVDHERVFTLEGARQHRRKQRFRSGCSVFHTFRYHKRFEIAISEIRDFGY